MHIVVTSVILTLSVFFYAPNICAIESPSPANTGQAAKESTKIAKSNTVKTVGLIFGGLAIVTVGILLASHNNGSHAHH